MRLITVLTLLALQATPALADVPLPDLMNAFDSENMQEDSNAHQVMMQYRNRLKTVSDAEVRSALLDDNNFRPTMAYKALFETSIARKLKVYDDKPLPWLVQRYVFLQAFHVNTPPILEFSHYTLSYFSTQITGLTDQQLNSLAAYLVKTPEARNLVLAIQQEQQKRVSDHPAKS